MYVYTKMAEASGCVAVSKGKEREILQSMTN
jgi:hypothetical protein